MALTCGFVHRSKRGRDGTVVSLLLLAEHCTRACACCACCRTILSIPLDTMHLALGHVRGFQIAKDKQDAERGSGDLSS